MYLNHFGLNSPPFKITPVTQFFFSGANRGEILDALIYAITESEGIIKVTGEVGSGKTMLCRMLLEQLPKQVECVYLANPSLSRDELLHAIADGLGLNLEGQRVNIILQTLQNLLAQKSRDGKRVAVLVDEAHAMPLDTLEELRLLYNLQVGDHKLLQLVLCGQPELNAKLELPNMRQLKDRIVHHFTMLPLSKSVIESYLLFRMRAAGYRGSNIFSPAATKLIGKASHGLMRRVNILADKALLAAFVEDTQRIEVRHVQAAMRDSELTPQRMRGRRKHIALSGGAALSVALLLSLSWLLGEADSTHTPAANQLNTLAASAPRAADSTAAGPAISGVIDSSAENAVPVSRVTNVQSAQNLAPGLKAPDPVEKESPATADTAGSLLQQRLAASHALLARHDAHSASIQLFYTTNTQATRMESFLEQARGLGKEKEIYLLPIKINGVKGYRVLYGTYPDTSAALVGMQQLPTSYKQTYAPTLFLLSSAN